MGAPESDDALLEVDDPEEAGGEDEEEPKAEPELLPGRHDAEVAGAIQALLTTPLSLKLLIAGFRLWSEHRDRCAELRENFGFTLTMLMRRGAVAAKHGLFVAVDEDMREPVDDREVKLKPQAFGVWDWQRPPMRQLLPHDNGLGRIFLVCSGAPGCTRWNEVLVYLVELDEDAARARVAEVIAEGWTCLRCEAKKIAHVEEVAEVRAAPPPTTLPGFLVGLLLRGDAQGDNAVRDQLRIHHEAHGLAYFKALFAAVLRFLQGHPPAPGTRGGVATHNARLRIFEHWASRWLSAEEITTLSALPGAPAARARPQRRPPQPVHERIAHAHRPAR